MECLVGLLPWLLLLRFWTEAEWWRLVVELDVLSPLLMRFNASEVKMTVEVEERKSRLLRSQAVKKEDNNFLKEN